MRIAVKLRVAFGVYVALLVAALAFEMRAMRRGVASGRELSAIAARLRVNNDIQIARLDEMGSSAAKFLVTRDAAYRDKLESAAGAFGDELHAFGSLRLTEDERARARAVAIRLRTAEEALRTALADSGGAAPETAPAAASAVERELDAIRLETLRLADATRAAMTLELARAEGGARAAERVAWIVAAGALLLAVLLSAILVRAIVRPLERLAEGARAIAAGRFWHRLSPRGDDELARVASDFDAMGERLAQLDAMKREFVSNVSHDLKTPLTSMQETTEALLDQLPGPVNDRQRRLLLLSQESGRRLSGMIAKVLELARLESGAAPAPRMETVDVVRVARGAVERAGMFTRTVLVVLDEPEENVQVHADADGVARVLDNLLENAIRFSPDGGTVHVSVSALGSLAEVSVADEGPGIPELERARIFERFYQTPDGRAVRAHGVGLGTRDLPSHRRRARRLDWRRGELAARHCIQGHPARPDRNTRGERGSRGLRGVAGMMRNGAVPLRADRGPWMRVILALVAASVVGACATTRVDRHVADRQRLERSIATLQAALDSVRAANDSLRLDASRLQFDVLDRDEELRALRLELQRLKAIDLRPRQRPTP